MKDVHVVAMISVEEGAEGGSWRCCVSCISVLFWKAMAHGQTVGWFKVCKAV